ncbi:MAG TPA: peptidylprolyl isomerase [Anaerolineales bacterium]
MNHEARLGDSRYERHLRRIFGLLFSISVCLLLAGCSDIPATATTPAAQAATSPAATPPTLLETVVPTVQSRGCSAVQTEPTAAAASIVPAVNEADYMVGPQDAVVTLVEYCDFQAPICRSMAAVVSNVINNHPQDVRLIFRPVPLIGRLDKTELAVQAAIAAGDQGHFWEMYDLLFQNTTDWDALTPEKFEAWLKDKSAQIGLEPGKFANSLKSQSTLDRMNAMYTSAKSFGLQSVPLLLINGQPQPAFSLDYETVNSVVSLIALGKRQFKECPPFTIDPSKQYIATLHTEKGDAVIELFADKAPLAVNSFVFLARQGWFDDITFHRVIAGSLAQTGDPSGTGRGNPGYFFANEIDPSLKFDSPGMVGMANQGTDTNGSQFFITLAAAPQFNGGFTIFGRVLSGLEVLEKLTPRDVQVNPRAPAGDRLISVTVEEK